MPAASSFLASSVHSHSENEPIVSTRHRARNITPASGGGRSPASSLQSDLARYNLGSPRVPVSRPSSSSSQSSSTGRRSSSCPPSSDPVPPYPGMAYSADSRPVTSIPISSPSSPCPRPPFRGTANSSNPRSVTFARSTLPNSSSADARSQQALPEALVDASAVYGERRVPTLSYNASPPAYDDLYGHDANKPSSKREAIARIARMVGRELVGGRK